jgi:hypothetical protein
MPDNTSPDSSWMSFVDKANRFLQKTQEHVLQGINPGGIYQGIWCRDAAYILRDWFLSGNIHGTMQQIYQIWSHQISSSNTEKLVYGRGSPEMKFYQRLQKKIMKNSLKVHYLQQYFKPVSPKSTDRNRILIPQP